MTSQWNRVLSQVLPATMLEMVLITGRAEQLLKAEPFQSSKLNEQVYLAALSEAKAIGGDPLRLATIQNNLAALYHEQGRYREAETLLREALRLREELIGKESFEVAITLSNLAEMIHVSGRSAEAEELCLKSIGILEKQTGLPRLRLAVSLNNLAELYSSQGRYRDAERLLMQAVGIEEGAPNPDQLNLATRWNNLALFAERRVAMRRRPVFFFVPCQPGKKCSVPTTQRWPLS